MSWDMVLYGQIHYNSNFLVSDFLGNNWLSSEKFQRLWRLTGLRKNRQGLIQELIFVRSVFFSNKNLTIVFFSQVVADVPNNCEHILQFKCWRSTALVKIVARQIWDWQTISRASLKFYYKHGLHYDFWWASHIISHIFPSRACVLICHLNQTWYDQAFARTLYLCSCPNEWRIVLKPSIKFLAPVLVFSQCKLITRAP